MIIFEWLAAVTSGFMVLKLSPSAHHRVCVCVCVLCFASTAFPIPTRYFFLFSCPPFRQLNSSSHGDENSSSCKPSPHHHGHPGGESRKKPYVKKPLNAFMLFMKEMRPKVISECTLKESAAINQILGRRVSREHSTVSPKLKQLFALVLAFS